MLWYLRNKLDIRAVGFENNQLFNSADIAYLQWYLQMIATTYDQIGPAS